MSYRSDEELLDYSDSEYAVAPLCDMVAIPGSNDPASSPTGATSSMQSTASSSSDTSVGVFEGQQEEITSMEDDDEGMAQAASVAHLPVEAAVPSTSYHPRPPPHATFLVGWYGRQPRAQLQRLEV
ncbi:hypothetical protein V1521DRAFT_447576 [Lipomyces starkeyi]